MKIILSSLILCSLWGIAYADYDTPLGAEYPSTPTQTNDVPVYATPETPQTTPGDLGNPGNTNPVIDQPQNTMYDQYNNNEF